MVKSRNERKSFEWDSSFQKNKQTFAIDISGIFIFCPLSPGWCLQFFPLIAKILLQTWSCHLIPRILCKNLSNSLHLFVGLQSFFFHISWHWTNVALVWFNLGLSSRDFLWCKNTTWIKLSGVRRWINIKKKSDIGNFKGRTLKLVSNVMHESRSPHF